MAPHTKFLTVPATAEAAIATFAEKYAPKYNKAVECLVKDREALLTFFDFRAEHWNHLRTSNPLESVFATVRHRTVRMKGALSQDTARLMVFKLVIAASKTWRKLQGQNQLPKVINHHLSGPQCELELQLQWVLLGHRVVNQLQLLAVQLRRTPEQRLRLQRRPAAPRLGGSHHGRCQQKPHLARCANLPSHLSTHQRHSVR
jgi:hypothetical protein